MFATAETLVAPVSLYSNTLLGVICGDVGTCLAFSPAHSVRPNEREPGPSVYLDYPSVSVLHADLRTNERAPVRRTRAGRA